MWASMDQSNTKRESSATPPPATDTHDVGSLAGRFDGDHILVPLLSSDGPVVTDQITVATTLAHARNASLSLISPVVVPDQTPKRLGRAVADDDDIALLDWALEQVADVTTAVDVDGGLLYTRDVVSGVLHAVDARDVDTLVLPSRPRRGRVRMSLPERINIQAACDVVVVNGQTGYELSPSILLPVAGGPHSGLATDVAQAFATDTDAWIDILHVIPTDASDRQRTEAKTLVDDVYHRIARPETTTSWVLESEDVAETIVEQSRYYGLTIIGAPTKGRLRRFIYGSTNRSVRADARSVVLSARSET